MPHGNLRGANSDSEEPDNGAQTGFRRIKWEIFFRHALSTFRDVTAELQREKEQSTAEKLKSVGVLAGGIAHDFNNILGTILGNIDMAIQLTRSEEKIYPFLRQVEKATRRAGSLTQQLLTFSKGGEPVKELSKIQETIEESASFALSGSKVACNYQWNEDLWAVEIDSGQISQVIRNSIY